MNKLQTVTVPLLKFLLLFALFYGTSLLVIGLSAPGGIYSSIVAQHFNFINGIKNLLIFFSKSILEFAGLHTKKYPGFILSVPGGRGIVIAMSCVGYGVYSFWLAYILANIASLKQKLLWACMGLIALFFINVMRIALYLWAINTQKSMPLGLDHHTWFNIAAYSCILVMIIFFERKTKTIMPPAGKNQNNRKYDHSRN